MTWRDILFGHRIPANGAVLRFEPCRCCRRTNVSPFCFYCRGHCYRLLWNLQTYFSRIDIVAKRHVHVYGYERRAPRCGTGVESSACWYVLLVGSAHKLEDERRTPNTINCYRGKEEKRKILNKKEVRRPHKNRISVLNCYKLKAYFYVVITSDLCASTKCWGTYWQKRWLI